MKTSNQNFKKNPLKQELKLVAILLSLVSIPVLIGLLVPQENIIKPPISARSLDALAKDYQAQGIKKYFKSKRSLKERILKELNNTVDKRAQFAAMNIATYLFPELLPNSHFEKRFAEENFVPLQMEIEKSPATVQAEVLYEKLHARVWNYENPRNTTRGLSDYAEKMLKIYQALAGNQR